MEQDCWLWKNLPMLINELAAKDLDLSLLTGIPHCRRSNCLANAGLRAEKVWIDSFAFSHRISMDGAW